MRLRQTKVRASRRRFLTAAGAAAGLGVPAIAKAQGSITLRLQSTWPEKDILHEYALDFAAKVNNMTGGDLRIEVLPSGALVAAAALLDAVSKGSLDGGHGVVSNHYAKHSALSLWGASPAFGMDANTLLAWHRYGGGKELLAKLYGTIGANVVSFLYGPMPTQPLGWFKKRILTPDDFKGLKFRAVGLSIQVFTGLGAVVEALPAREIAAAMQHSLIDGAEFNNPTSDRALGLAEVSKVYMQQSYHQPSEQFEILFNKLKFDALPQKLKAIIENAVEAASADLSWKAIDRYSKDYLELHTKDRVRTYKTPEAVLQRQLEAYDAAASKLRSDPRFREIEESQRRFAERAVRWYLDTQVSPGLAYAHYFGKKPPARRPAKK
jgi:TRAP-type mannitol/chloroaromatic compound transport system substrate-binding protein